jgi:transposase
MNVRLSHRPQPGRTRPTRHDAERRQTCRRLKRAQILFAADAGETDEAIAANVCVGLSTMYRTKRRFVLGNLEAALSEAPHPGAARKLSAKQQALLVATARTTPPADRRR